MAHSYHHALSSVKRHGGQVSDYLPLHDWFDATKAFMADFRHRALRHHSQGIFEAERVFGTVLINSDGVHVPVRVLGEQHVMEDFSGFIPTPSAWLRHIQKQDWMQPNPAYQRDLMASISV